jgi:hypothetical protein
MFDIYLLTAYITPKPPFKSAYSSKIFTEGLSLQRLFGYFGILEIKESTKFIVDAAYSLIKASGILYMYPFMSSVG